MKLRALFGRKKSKRAEGLLAAALRPGIGIAGLLVSVLPSGAEAALPACLNGYSLYSDVQSVFRNNDTLASGKIGSNGYVELGLDGRANGNIAARGSVLLRDRAKVFANVTSGGSVTLHSGAQVTGTLQQYASVPVCALPQESFSYGTQDVTVNVGATTDLLPGSYRDVLVYANGRLKLRAGTYRFKSFRTVADGRLEFNTANGNVEVFASVAVAIGDRTPFYFTGAVQPEKVKIHSQQTSELTIGTDIEFRGTLVAPLAEVHAFQRTVFRGSVYAKSLNFEPYVDVHSVPYAGALPVVDITGPSNGYVTNQSVINVSWTVDGVTQTTQTTETLLVEGNNKVKRCSGGACDSINVVRDQTPPVVQITSPANGLITNQTTISLAWKVDGVTQTTQTSHTLLEGQNTVTRTATDAAGNTGMASISVTRDTQAPVVVITSPLNGALTNQTSVPVAWKVDGVAQTTQLTQNLAVEGANAITRTATDAAGNTGTTTITVTRDTQGPVVVITSPANGSLSNQTSIPVAWTVDGVPQTAQTSQNLSVEGANAVSRSFTDAAGNTGTASITVNRDTQAPVVQIQSPASGFLTNQSSVAVSWTVDGVAQTAGTTENLPAEGTNAITRSAADAAGNVGSASVSVIRDTQAPVVAITSPANGLVTNVDSVDVSWTVDGAPQATVRQALAEGPNTIARSFTDAAGNAGTATVTVIRDTQAPVVLITSPAPGITTSATVIPVAWTADGVAQTVLITESLSAEGANVITRTVTDAAGNTGTATLTVYRDTQAPAVVITSPVNGFLTNQASLVVSWTVDGVLQTAGASEALAAEGSNVITRSFTDAAGNTGTASITVTRDTQAPVVAITGPASGSLTNQTTIPIAWIVDGTAQTAQVTENLITEGANTITRSATDAAGNTGTATITVTRDTQAPVVAIASPADGFITNQATIPVVWSVDGANQSGQTTETLGSEGSNVITRSFTDAAGNTGTASITVTRDTQAPVVAITGPASGSLTNQTTIPIAWTVDGTAQTAQVTENLAVEGANTITRSATDAAGNTGTSTITVTRDTQAPVVSIASPADGFITNQATIPVVWSVDGANQTSQTTETLDSEGANVVTRSFTDAAGNTGTASVTVTRDSQSPVIVIQSPANGHLTNRTSLSVAWSVDGVQQTTGTTETLGLEGENVITRTAADAAGNTGSVSISVTRDTQPPLVAITSPANGATVTVSPISVAWSVDGAPQGTGLSQSLVLGQNHITRSATDAAGNVGSASVTVTLLSQDTVVNGLHAQAHASPTNGGTALTVQFTGKGWADTGRVAFHKWDFDGNGVFDTIMPAVPDTTLLRQFDFETGAEGFVFDGTGGNLALAHGGSRTNSRSNHLWSTNPLPGTYQNYTSTVLTSPPIAVPPGTTGLNLSFRHALMSEPCCDYGYVQIDVGYGFEWVESYSGFLGESDANLDISNWIGETIRIRFQFGSDYSITAAGWQIDDVVVRATDGSGTHVLFSDDFEGGNTWESENEYFGSTWTLIESGSDPGASIVGLGSGWLDSDTSSYAYPNFEDAAATSPNIGLPAGATLRLAYHQFLSVADTGDGGVVEISRNGGPFTPIEPIGGYPGAIEGVGRGFTGTLGVGRPMFDLSPFAGDSVAVRFHFYSDASGSGRGWIIDSIRILRTFGFEGGVSQVSHTFAAQGAHYAVFAVADSAGNERRADIRPTTVTVGPPGAQVVSIVSPVQGANLNSMTVPVRWKVGDEMQSLDTTETFAAEGINVLSRSFTDGTGYTAVATITVTVDTTSPVVAILSPADGFLTRDYEIPVVWSVNGFIQDTANLEALSQEGENTVTRTVVDSAGNVASASITVRRDTYPPRVEFLDLVTYDLNYLTDPTFILRWRVDGGPIIVETITLVEGWNFVERWAEDSAGNAGFSRASVILDTEAPVVEFLEPEDGHATSQADIEVTWSIDGWMYTETVHLDAEGPHTLVRTHTDEAGNVGTATITVYLDTQKPVVAILEPRDGQGVNTPVADVVWTMDGVTQLNGATEALLPGVNVIKRVGVDAAGNADSAMVTVYLDTTAPTVQIVSPRKGAVVHDSVIPVIWKADGVVQALFAEAHLVVGQNAIIRTFPDSLGNVGADTAIVTYTTEPPVVEILSPQNGETMFISPIDVIWAVDGAVQDTLTVETLHEGVNTITREAYGAGGNTQREEISIRVYLDSQAEICQP